MQCLITCSTLPDCMQNSAAGAAGSADLAIGSQKSFLRRRKKFFWTIPQEGRERH